MRLIDADELKKKIRHWNYNATTSTPTFCFVTDEDIDYMPTVCDIEQIRAEIEQYEAECTLIIPINDRTCNRCTIDTFKDIYQIIDKYTKGERE